MPKIKESYIKLLDKAESVPDFTHEPCTGILCFGKPCPANCMSKDGGDNCVEVEIAGDYAMFANVITSGSAEKYSYDIPTYEAIRRILGAIYQKPTFNWVVDRVRVMNEIRHKAEGRLQTAVYGNFDKGKNKTLVSYSFLHNVRYQVRAHIEWNYNHGEMEDDRCYRKHLAIFERCIDKPRRVPVLGMRECLATVSRCKFGEGEGAYDNEQNHSLSFMYHSMTYADEAILPDERGFVTKNMWEPVMTHGVIEFCRPQECPRRERIKPGTIKKFNKVVHTQGADGNVTYKVLDPESEYERKLYEREKQEGME